MRSHDFTTFFFAALLASAAYGDQPFFYYEGDVIPLTSDGWLIDPCETPCTPSVEDGHLVFRWSASGDGLIYAQRFSESSRSLWVEWRFRSNHLLPANFYTCDGRMGIAFRSILEIVFLFGNAAVSFSGNDVAYGLDAAEFHTYRFESADGINWRVSVDGRVFIENSDFTCCNPTTFSIGGDGGCPPHSAETINEWDFVRLGTLSSRERIVATNPPQGVLDAQQYPNLDRFVVTFDSPNYVYIQDIAVEVIGSEPRSRGGDGEQFRAATVRERSYAAHESRAAGLSPRGATDAVSVPQVIATRRLDNGNPEDVEIVLDRPLPRGATTRFTVTDPGDPSNVNVIEYTVTAALNGACCQSDGTCTDTTDPPCTAAGGTFTEGATCTALAVCCLPGGACRFTAPVCCAQLSGILTQTAGSCEGDADGDGVDGACGDPCPLDFNNDSDGDGVCIPEDQCPDDPAKTDPGVCGCNVSDTADADGDTISDCNDQCPGVSDALFAPGCIPAIPAISNWGLLILALMLLTIAKLRLRRRAGATSG